MRLEPFDFQKEAIRKLSKQQARLCGDDMGLGKTLVGVELDLANRAQAESGRRLKTLIVTKTGVISDGAWQKAIASQAGDVPVYVIDRKNRAKFVAAARDGRKPGYFVVHWQGLRLMKELRDVEWFHIIGDEVQMAKNRKAQLTQTFWTLRTEFKTGLSGTWAENQPQDAWAILHWLWPSYYRSYWNFVKHYCIVEQAPGGYMKVTGVKNIQSLNEEMEPWYIRRKKEDVLKDLPDKYYTDFWVELSPTQRRTYDEMKKELIAWVGKQDQERPLIASVVIAQLTRLQQFAIASAEVTGYVEKTAKETGETYIAPVVKMVDPSSKIDRLMELLEDTDLDSEPIVVFSQFKGSIRLLEARCREAGIKLATLTGDTKEKDRIEAIAGFQQGRFQVFAGTIAAGGVGITLTRASTVVFLDRAWSPSMNLQAEDRLHRIGQKNAVQVIDIMAHNTIDLGRRTQVETKWSWLKQMLGDK